MAAPIVLKSYSDSGDKAGGGGYWQIDFTTVGPISEPEDANLDQYPNPLQPATGALMSDFNGTLRRITISGTRGNGELNNGVAMSNADWIRAIRGKMAGQQSFIGPFRLVKQFANATIWTNETVYCGINTFTPSMNAGVPSEIAYSLELLVGQ